MPEFHIYYKTKDANSGVVSNEQPQRYETESYVDSDAANDRVKQLQSSEEGKTKQFSVHSVQPKGSSSGNFGEMTKVPKRSG